jgi:meso-butanediol dehydrogenase / (S,S)-butanediol dehydrogenase / diacetyl reductase
MAQLSDKTALITGGSTGIGRAIAIELARAGADIALSYVDELDTAATQYCSTKLNGKVAAEDTLSEILKLDHRAVAIQCDVRKKEDNQRLITETVRQLSRLDILVCSAGVVNLGSVEELSEECIDIVLDVNLKGTILTCQAAITSLNSSGCIINIASIAGKTGIAGLAHYCASKFGVVGFTNALAKELAGRGIRANTICPGIVRTQMWEYFAEAVKLPGESKDEAFTRWVTMMIPMGRPQTPEDMGKAALYLAMMENVTGQAINVDGGSVLF